MTSISSSNTSSLICNTEQKINKKLHKKLEQKINKKLEKKINKSLDKKLENIVKTIITKTQKTDNNINQQGSKISNRDNQTNREKTTSNKTPFHTLDHTPILSSGLEMFSSYTDHQKDSEKKCKQKCFFTYVSGIMSVFALSLFGFILGSPNQDILKANILESESNLHTSSHIESSPMSSPETSHIQFTNKLECLENPIAITTAELSRKNENPLQYCNRMFPKKTHYITN